MKLFKDCLILIFLGIFFCFPSSAFWEDNNSNLLSGKIIFNSNSLNELWYVYPGDFHRYYIGDPKNAFEIIKNLSLGVSNVDFDKISSTTSEKLKGLIIIKVEDFGKAYYINPNDNSLVYLPKAEEAYYLLRHFAMEMNKGELKTIPEGKIILDESGKEISRQWQYLGWWAKINQKNVPVMAEPKNKSKKLGRFSSVNKIKILEIKKTSDGVWYKIDGGQYPGAYVNAKFVSPISQPVPEKEIIIPATVKKGDYWLDLNMTKNILTLYKDSQPVLATYASTGVAKSPTLSGLFNVYYKYKKTRMRGAPPRATHYYDLADVPWTIFYYGSYAVHGTYWHDEFGGMRSAGCTNTTQGDAKFIFDLVSPAIIKGNHVRAKKNEPGTVVYNHY